MKRTAAEIYQDNLDEVTRRFFTGDLSRIDELIAVPCEVETSDARLRIERLEDLLAMLKDQRESLLRLGTTDYHRICMDAEYADPAATRIDGRHRTHVLRAGTYLMDPYPCRQTLVRQGTQWRAVRLSCEVRNSDYTVIGPRVVAQQRAARDTDNCEGKR